MPVFIKTAKDEEIWDKAKSVVDRSKYPDDDSYYAVVTTVYKNMGGKIESFKPQIIYKLAEKYKEQNFKEVNIDDIKDFVKKFIDNPLKTAVVAYLIYKILVSNTQKESYKEGIDPKFIFYPAKHKIYKHGDCHNIAAWHQRNGLGKWVDFQDFVINNKIDLGKFPAHGDHSITTDGNMIYDPVYNNEYFHTSDYRFTKDNYIKLLLKHFSEDLQMSTAPELTTTVFIKKRDEK